MKAALDGTIATAGGVTVQATGNYDVDATTEVLAVGIGFAGAGAGANANVTETANVEALVGGGAISSTGAVLVKADGTYDSLAVSDVGAGEVLAIGIALPSATNEAGVRAKLDGDVTSATGINVEAYGTRATTSTSEAVSVGLGAVRAGKAEAKITDKANTDAIIGSNSDINVPSAPVVVKSVATNDAKAYISSHTLGAVAVTITSPTAEVKATTSAQLNGDVGTTTTGVGIDGVSGTIGIAGASSVSVTAAAVDRASAKVVTLTVGLVSVDPSTAKATVQSNVSAAAGGGQHHRERERRVHRRVAHGRRREHRFVRRRCDQRPGPRFDRREQADRFRDRVRRADPGGHAPDDRRPPRRAAAGAVRRHDPCVNFGAGDGSTCGNVAESINFEKPHGLITGDTVTYEANGLIGGLTDGAIYPVILAGAERLPPRRPVRARTTSTARPRRARRPSTSTRARSCSRSRTTCTPATASATRPTAPPCRPRPASSRARSTRSSRSTPSGSSSACRAPSPGRSSRARTSTPAPRSSTSRVTGSTRTTPSRTRRPSASRSSRTASTSR